MDHTPLLSYEGMKHKAFPCLYYFNILGIPFLIGILYAVLITDSDCQNTRLWLYIEAGVQFIITIASIAQISKRFISKSGFLVKFPLFLTALFQITWLVMGTLWIFSGEKNCFEVFPEGFVMIAAICLVCYNFILVIMILYIITVIVESRRKKH